MTIQKILLVYSKRPPIIEDLSMALRKQGVEVDHVYVDENHWFDRFIINKLNKYSHSLRIIPKTRNLFSQHPLSHKNYRTNKVIEKIELFDPDMIFIIRGINIDYEKIQSRAKFFAWWIEREERVAEPIRELHFFDWYFFMNQSCVEKVFATGYKNASYMSHLVNPQRFYPIANTEKKYDLCFVGNWSPIRQNYLEAASKITQNIAIYGKKWRRNNLSRPHIFNAVKGKWIEGNDLNNLYNQSKIVLNVTNWGFGSGKKRSGMNMRVFEVPASGAFLLTDESLETEQFLEPNKHIGIYDGIDDLQIKIQHFLIHSKEREAIAYAGSSFVRDNYSYDVLAKTLCEKYLQI